MQHLVKFKCYFSLQVQHLLFVAGATLNEIQLLLFVAGATLGEFLNVSRAAKYCIFQ